MKIKVLHYVYYADPISSGYTIRTHSIVKAQKEFGLFPSVAISLKSTFKNYFRKVYFLSQNIIDGIHYYSPHKNLLNSRIINYILIKINFNNKISRHLKKTFYSLIKNEVLKNYSKFLKSELTNVDLIHVHAPAITFNEVYSINKNFQKKIIYEVRGFWNLSIENNNYDVKSLIFDEIEACHKADKCIAICQGIADALIEGGVPADKIEIVPNAVEPDEFSPIGKDFKLTQSLNLEDKIIFGYITSVRWLEGVQTVIKAWPNILKEIPNAVFLLIGDGDYLGTLKSMIKEYGIERSFLTLGKIAHKNISSYYSIIDIFVIPRIDTPVSHIVTPLKPLEAMMNKKSIIVSNVNALKELVIDGNTGLHFNADDEKHLAEICVKLAKDDKLRLKLGEAAKDWVIKNRTWDIIAKQYSEIYKNLLVEN